MSVGHRICIHGHRAGTSCCGRSIKLRSDQGVFPGTRFTREHYAAGFRLRGEHKERVLGQRDPGECHVEAGEGATWRCDRPPRRATTLCSCAAVTIPRRRLWYCTMSLSYQSCPGGAWYCIVAMSCRSRTGASEVRLNRQGWSN